MERYLIEEKPESAVSDYAAESTLEVIDGIITEIYLPYRGDEDYKTERAVLVEEAHVPHRENDAEHSWHVTFTVLALWNNRVQLGLNFPDDFDIGKALKYASVHDVVEIWADDVDMLTHDENLIRDKKANELAAQQFMKDEYPFMEGISDTWLEYEHKDNYEAQFVSDIDKMAALRMIALDGGKKWQSAGYTREHMCKRTRDKLITPIGHALMDAAERDLDGHPEYFSFQDRLF